MRCRSAGVGAACRTVNVPQSTNCNPARGIGGPMHDRCEGRGFRIGPPFRRAENRLVGPTPAKEFCFKYRGYVLNSQFRMDLDIGGTDEVFSNFFNLHFGGICSGFAQHEPRERHGYFAVAGHRF